MKVKGLDNRLYNWKLLNHVPLGDDERNRSKYHLAARQLLTQLFPTDRVLEEVPLPGSGGLTADFLIPAEKLIIEVHGEQHYKYVMHFHGSLLGFIAARKRDMNKKRWCELNGIRLVELPYTEAVDEWRRRIREYPSDSTEV